MKHASFGVVRFSWTVSCKRWNTRGVMRNSWSCDWGEMGYERMAFDALDVESLCVF